MHLRIETISQDVRAIAPQKWKLTSIFLFSLFATGIQRLTSRAKEDALPAKMKRR
jgi:hypothetical protein